MWQRGHNLKHPVAFVFFILVVGIDECLLEEITMTQDRHICKFIAFDRLDMVQLCSFTFTTDSFTLDGDLTDENVKLYLIAGNDKYKYDYVMNMNALPQDVINVNTSRMALPEKASTVHPSVKASFNFAIFVKGGHRREILNQDSSELYWRDLHKDVLMRFTRYHSPNPEHNFSIIQDFSFLKEDWSSYVLSQDVFKNTHLTVIYPLRITVTKEAWWWFYTTQWDTTALDSGNFHNIERNLDSTTYFYMVKSKQPDKVHFFRSDRGGDIQEGQQFFPDTATKVGFIYRSNMYLFDDTRKCVHIIIGWANMDLETTAKEYDHFQLPRVNVPFEKFFKCGTSDIDSVDPNRYPPDRCETKSNVDIRGGSSKISHHNQRRSGAFGNPWIYAAIACVVVVVVVVIVMITISRKGSKLSMSSMKSTGSSKTGGGKGLKAAGGGSATGKTISSQGNPTTTTGRTKASKTKTSSKASS